MMTQRPAQPASSTPQSAPETREKGAPINGQPQFLDKRLFVQLLAFDECSDVSELTNELKNSNIEGVLYKDVNDPLGVALLTFHESPQFFPTRLRDFLNDSAFKDLMPKPEFTMFGRTYSSGYEADLEDWLLKKPRRTALNPDLKWAIWYPLRRSGAFAKLSAEEQSTILREHGTIGRSYGEADLAHDIRLACFGLDKEDNDFVIGLTGKELHPLSLTVQAMRKTQQTSTYMEKMGPFFVGYAVWQSKLLA